MKRTALADGFTLLEVMVTLFLFTILMGLAIPHMGLGQQETMRATANRFRNVLIWLRDQGAFGQAEYRLRIDPHQGLYRCEVLRKDTFIPVNDPLLQPGILDPAQGRIIWKPDKNELPDLSEIIIKFNRYGPERPIMVQFVVNQKETGFTVSYRPEWTKPRLEEGLLAWE